MSLYVPTGTPSLISGAVARIERRLPEAGTVTVRAGQRVEAEDVVAHAFLPARPQIVNVARALSIPPAAVERAMKKEVGNKIAQGEALARSNPLGWREFRTPVGGIITAVDSETGYVTITPDPVKYELQASVRGLVMDVLPGRGVRIETPAAQVFGAFGFGPERSGVLQLLVTDPSEAIAPDMITTKHSYAILIGGSTITAAGLRRAVKEQVRGVIVGSIEAQQLADFLGWSSHHGWRVGVGNWHMLPTAEAANDLTLVVTEGFGNLPMASPLFELLAAHDRQESLIVGQTQLRFSHARPRVVIPLSSRTAGVQLDPPRPAIRAGAQVRLLNDADLGRVGRVRSISNTMRRLPSQVRTHTVEVVFEDGSTVVVPLVAAEALD